METLLKNKVSLRQAGSTLILVINEVKRTSTITNKEERNKIKEDANLLVKKIKNSRSEKSIESYIKKLMLLVLGKDKIQEIKNEENSKIESKAKNKKIVKDNKKTIKSAKKSEKSIDDLFYLISGIGKTVETLVEDVDNLKKEKISKEIIEPLKEAKKVTKNIEKTQSKSGRRRGGEY